MADPEMSEDLDYHITFPSPISQDFSDDDFEDLGAGLHKEPVVILLGWMGCQEKHLSKYSSIYEQRKCITIQYTAPTEQVFYKPESMQPIAVKILELIVDLNLEDNPIFFHVFSNSGGYIYRYITYILTTDPQFGILQVRGCVTDSAPSQRRILVAAKALMATMRVNMVLKYIIAFLWIIYILTQRLFNFVAKPLGMKGNTNTLTMYESYYQCLKNNLCPWPQLFLYSKGDEIVPYYDIEEVIEARKAKGITVFSKCWENSAHVSHLRFHHDEYIKQCYDFMDHCLKVD